MPEIDRSIRSNRREVRNPVFALPGLQAVLDLPPETRAALAMLLASIVADARRRAQDSWAKNKGPMAAYWKALGAYAEHIRRAIKPCPAAPPLAWDPPSGDGWLPIYSAPKDGSTVDLWCVHANARYAKDPIGEGWAAAVEGRWIDFNGGGWTWHGLSGVHTHWRPKAASGDHA